MADLDAFFAKKASKGKKKGVIKLEEIGEQLERRAMEHREETEDNENKPITEDLSKIRPVNENNEDSEWLGFDDKPSAPVAVKEMVDAYIESENEEKSASVEPARTWKTNSEEVADSEAVVNSEPAKYVPPKAKKEFDLKNEEMFPSIEKAPEVEQKLKEQEEISRRAKMEERKQQEEKEKEKAEKAKLYKPRAQFGEDSNLRPKPTGNPSSADSQENWRAKPKEDDSMRAKSTGKFVEDDSSSRAKPTGNTSSADSQENWRAKSKEEDSIVRAKSTGKSGEDDSSFRANNKPTGNPSSADSQENWRAKSKPSASVQQETQTTEARSTPEGSAGKNVYKPPHLRK